MTDPRPTLAAELADLAAGPDARWGTPAELAALVRIPRATLRRLARLAGELEPADPYAAGIERLGLTRDARGRFVRL